MSEPLALDYLDEDARRQLCIELIEEFGGQVTRETDKGELRHRCTLPFGTHGDRNSITASVNYKTLVANCWVCKNGGSLLWWIAANRGEDTERTVHWLKDNVKVDGDQMLAATITLIESIVAEIEVGRRSETSPISTYDRRILGPWLQWGKPLRWLTDPPSQGGRNLPADTLTEFAVGFCDRDEHWGYLDRVMIPVFWQDELVGWQARRLNPEDPIEAKYLNSPDFPRDRVLYGHPEGDWAVVVESPMSVLRHHHHLPMIATLGAAVTEQQLGWLIRRFRRLVWFFDNDKGGYTALEGTKNNPGVVEESFRYAQVEIVANPYFGADPADLDDDDMEVLVADALLPGQWQPPREEDLVPYQSKE